MRLSALRSVEFTTESAYASKVKATSAAVTGGPSCHRALGSRWKVRVSGSFHSQLRATCAVKPESPNVPPAGPISASFRKIWSNMSRSTAAVATGGNSVVTSPVAANTMVPQYSPVQPARRVQADTARQSSEKPAAVRHGDRSEVSMVPKDFTRVLAAPGPRRGGEGTKRWRKRAEEGGRGCHGSPSRDNRRCDFVERDGTTEHLGQRRREADS